MLSERKLPVAVVTGATGGMGQAIVRDLSADHHVVAVGRNADLLASLAVLPNVSIMALELTDFDAVERAVSALPRIDVLVHTAAVSRRKAVGDAGPRDWEEQFAINVVAPAVLTRAALPLLRRVRGQVIFINSGAGTKPVAHHAVYSASKHALYAVADCLRLEEASHYVRVSTVAPGPTDTPMFQGTGVQGGDVPERLIEPASVAAAVRLVVNATSDTQITQVTVRPRTE